MITIITTASSVLPVLRRKKQSDRPCSRVLSQSVSLWSDAQCSAQQSEELELWFWNCTEMNGAP